MHPDYSFHVISKQIRPVVETCCADCQVAGNPEGSVHPSDEYGETRIAVLVLPRFPIRENGRTEADLNEAAMRRTHSRVAEPAVEVI